ncbi:MAG: MBL fold metallo-hydrolase, partial [Firmicutes bacterium]|nr:MBL fold metallo-hydrolase [Bacillota bacterium]
MTITKGVIMLESSASSHVFLIQSDENLLIDTGNPGAFAAIWSELRSLGCDSIAHILLTHHDVDHIGNAQRLQQET